MGAIRFHSLAQASKPRPLNRRMPWWSLMSPRTGSIIRRRCSQSRRPRLVVSLRRIRSRGESATGMQLLGVGSAARRV